MPSLVTGAAGFIGAAVCKRLLQRGDSVVGIDNVNDYYDPVLKRARLATLAGHAAFSFIEMDIVDRPAMAELFNSYRFDVVVHLAAQAGVRYSIENPAAYVDSNIVGFGNVLEGARQSRVQHLVYASSSSVYGLNASLPFSEHENVDHPVSLYAATKKANELMAHSYAHLFGLPCTGLRFFTVYGPWGRPDMALFRFTERILAGEPILVYNHGRMTRDFTYIDDIVTGVVGVMDKLPQPVVAEGNACLDPARSSAPYRIYNIGNNKPVELMDFIRALERVLGLPAKLELLPMQPGDVVATMADVSDLAADIGFSPNTPIDEGLTRFVEWYLEHYRQGIERRRQGVSAGSAVLSRSAERAAGGGESELERRSR